MNPGHRHLSLQLTSPFPPLQFLHASLPLKPPIPLVQLAICDSPSPVMFRFSPGGFIIISPLSHLSPRRIISLYKHPSPPSVISHSQFRRRLLPPRPNQHQKDPKQRKERNTNITNPDSYTDSEGDLDYFQLGFGLGAGPTHFARATHFFTLGLVPVHGWSHGDMGH